VAEVMKQSDVFVFFTRFETFGCVIIEANACGVPVIVTSLEVTKELIHDGFNGVLVENENVAELSVKILECIKEVAHFDLEKISAYTVEKFNFETVSRQFAGWYDTVLRKG
jgi:glycosyltransferase involved in cell wall biosynthesis